MVKVASFGELALLVWIIRFYRACERDRTHGTRWAPIFASSSPPFLAPADDVGRRKSPWIRLAQTIWVMQCNWGLFCISARPLQNGRFPLTAMTSLCSFSRLEGRNSFCSVQLNALELCFGYSRKAMGMRLPPEYSSNEQTDKHTKQTSKNIIVM